MAHAALASVAAPRLAHVAVSVLGTAIVGIGAAAAPGLDAALLSCRMDDMEEEREREEIRALLLLRCYYLW